jgi:hypothetical protein
MVAVCEVILHDLKKHTAESFKLKELVKVRLTGEVGMVIDVYESNLPNYEIGYLVRLPNYNVHKFYEFEIAKRK